MNPVYQVANGWHPHSMSRMSLRGARLGQEVIPEIPRLIVEVIDKFDQPIEGAEVTIRSSRLAWSSSGKSDADGTFSSDLPPVIQLQDTLEVTATYDGVTNTLTKGAPSGLRIMSIQLDIGFTRKPIPDPAEVGIPTWAVLVGAVAATGLVAYIATR